MKTPSAALRLIAAVCPALLLLASPVALRAGVAEKVLHPDVDVITVTDVTEAGKSLAPTTPDRPVHYQLVYAGEVYLGPTWAGESLPPNQEIIRWLMASLQTQGYLPADQAHPAEQLFVFGWGMREGSTARPALGFLGGDKTNLIMGKYEFSSRPETRLHRPQVIRNHLEQKIWDAAEGSLFLGIVRSYSMDSLSEPKPTRLWETRFGCPAAGLALEAGLPLMLKAASFNFGRETLQPVALNVTESFNRVALGEFKVLGEYKSLNDADLPAKTRELAVEVTKARL